MATRSEPPPQVCPRSGARGAAARRHAADALFASAERSGARSGVDCVATAASPKGEEDLQRNVTQFVAEASEAAPRPQPHPAKRKGKGTPKSKDEARPSRASRSEVARAPRATGAAPRRGEGTATKRSGSGATRKTQRAGQRAATRGRREREAEKKGNGRNAQRTPIDGRSVAVDICGDY